MVSRVEGSTVNMTYTIEVSDWKVADEQDKARCAELFPDKDSKHIFWLGLDTNDGTAVFGTYLGDPEADLYLMYGDDLSQGGVTWCSWGESPEEVSSDKLSIQIVDDNKVENYEWASVRFYDVFTDDFLGVTEVEIQDNDEGTGPGQIPDDPDPGVLSEVAGGSKIGVGKPALTSYVGGIGSIELEVDQQRRVYFSQDDAVHRIEADGSLGLFLELSEDANDFDRNLIMDMAISQHYLYLAVLDILETYSRIIKVDLDTLEREYQFADYGIIDNLVVDSKGTVYLGAPENFEGPASSMAVDLSDDSLIIANRDQIYRFFPDSGEQIPLVTDENYGSLAVGSMAVLPSGDILLLSNGAVGLFGEDHEGDKVYLLTVSTGRLQLLAGNGLPGQEGDGGPAADASILADDLKADLDGNYFLSTERIRGNNLRIRRVESRRNTISTVAGQPGFLSCASSTESQLTGTSGIEIDRNGVILTQSNNAILGIDTGLKSIYTLAGIYGSRGYSLDGVSAFGNPMTPWSGEDIDFGPNYTEDGFTVGPDGDLYFREQYYIRRMDRGSGNLSTVTEGEYYFLQHDGDHHIYAFADGNFVRIDTVSGNVSIVANGGGLWPVQPSPYPWNDQAGNLNDVAWDSSGNIFVSVNDYNSEFQPSGIYRIDAQTEDWTPIVLYPPGSGQAIMGELVLDEQKGVIYYSNLTNGEDAYGRQLFIPVIKVDITTGQQTRVAGIDSRAGKYRFSENPLQAELYIRDMTLENDGSLLLVAGGQWWGIPDIVLRISTGQPADDSLIPQDIGQGANVGASIARQGDWLAVGVPDSDGGGSSTGEVLIYRDTDCRLLLNQRLRPPQGYTARKFGQEIAFADEVLVVGATGASISTTQSNDKQTDSPFRFGLFGKKSGSWRLDRELSDTLPEDSGDTSALTAHGSQVAIGLPGANDGHGSVVVLDTGSPDNTITIASPEPGIRSFGRSVSLGFNHVAVGSRTVAEQGRASLYQFDGSGFQQIGLLGAEDNRPGFAASLALSEEALYVGAPDNSGGRVYDYSLGDGLALFDTLADPDNSGNPSFGASLAIEGGVLVVGSPGESAAQAKTAGSGQKPENVPGIGAIYAFGIKDRARGRQPGQLLFSRLADAAVEAYGHAIDIKDGRIVVGAPASGKGRGSFESVPQLTYESLLSGLWYDPDKDGEGFNVLVSDAAMVIYYYGYTREGQRLWLVSGPITGEFGFGEEIFVPLYKSLDGSFKNPVSSSESLVEYGVLSVSFGSARSATFNINGFDGNKVSRSTFLLDAEANAAAYSGLWYDTQNEGEGFNVISGVAGTIIYYYGSSSENERLWLISDALPNDISDGALVQGRIYEATGGDFFHPEPSASALREWGSIEARFDDCRNGRFVLQGSDGTKVSDVFKLAGVFGADCQ